MAVACTMGCSSTNSTQVDDVHLRTARNGAVATTATEIERSSNGVRFAWNVRTQQTWQEYRADMLEAFRSDFRVVRSDASSLLLSRSTRGDSYHVEFQLMSSSPITDVHVVFSAIAD